MAGPGWGGGCWVEGAKGPLATTRSRWPGARDPALPQSPPRATPGRDPPHPTANSAHSHLGAVARVAIGNGSHPAPRPGGAQGGGEGWGGGGALQCAHTGRTRSAVAQRQVTASLHTAAPSLYMLHVGRLSRRWAWAARWHAPLLQLQTDGHCGGGGRLGRRAWEATPPPSVTPYSGMGCHVGSPATPACVSRFFRARVCVEAGM